MSSRRSAQGGDVIKRELIVTLNGGSSSLKFAAFDVAEPHEQAIRGEFDRLGRGQATTLRIDQLGGATEELSDLDHGSATGYLLGWLAAHREIGRVVAIGHRIVHGGPRYRQHAIIDATLMDELHRIVGYAPEHLPAAIEMITTARERVPDVLHVACFDTAFHNGLPAVSRILPLPRRFLAQGVERYGFHGLSYSFLLGELHRLAGADVANGRVILAHMGNGVSLAALRDGRSIDTSMGFTPAAGIPMGTRSGDVDPGLVRYLAQSEGWDAGTFDTVMNHQSGLLGISETSSDVRDLLAREGNDARAADALALFCYAIKKTIGAYAAALGGLDTLVFSGGIGENAASIRARVCAGLEFLGIDVDAGQNAVTASVISSAVSRVTVRVVSTNEEAVMVEAVAKLMSAKENSR